MCPKVKVSAGLCKKQFPKKFTCPPPKPCDTEQCRKIVKCLPGTYPPPPKQECPKVLPCPPRPNLVCPPCKVPSIPKCPPPKPCPKERPCPLPTRCPPTQCPKCRYYGVKKVCDKPIDKLIQEIMDKGDPAEIQRLQNAAQMITNSPVDNVNELKKRLTNSENTLNNNNNINNYNGNNLSYNNNNNLNNNNTKSPIVNIRFNLNFNEINKDRFPDKLINILSKLTKGKINYNSVKNKIILSEGSVIAKIEFKKQIDADFINKNISFIISSVEKNFNKPLEEIDISEELNYNSYANSYNNSIDNASEESYLENLNKYLGNNLNQNNNNSNINRNNNSNINRNNNLNNI